MNRITYLTIFLFFLSRSSFCQTAAKQIKGRVVDNRHAPLTGATISMLDKENRNVIGTVADSGGRFAFAYAIDGQYRLKVTFSGFNEHVSATFRLEDKDFGNIILEPSSKKLNEVVVQNKKGLVELEANSIIYNVSKSIDAQGVSAFDALKKAPGVYIDNDRTITLNGKQGTMILLDGKQTYLSGKELIDLLKSMPSTGIKSIEIINSPSAKHDASGAAGMINIRTSKSQVKGFNGTLTSGLTYGISVKHVQDLSFNYRKDKFNLYGSYNHFLGYRWYVYGSDRTQLGKTYDSSTDDTDKRKNMGSRLGFDYTLNKKNTIGVLLNGNFVFGGGITDTRTDIGSSSSAQIEQVLDAVNDYYHQQTERYNVNVNYKFEDTVGRIINFDVDYGWFDKGNSNLQSNIYRNNQSILSQNYYRSFTDIDINLMALKFDYTTNLLKGKLETGVKFSDIASDNNSKFFHALANRDSLDQRRTNHFRFGEQIASGYINYKKTIGKWSLQGGVRLENSASDGALNYTQNGIESLEHIKRNYTNLFPSLSASVKVNAKNALSLGYSRRIDRPAYQDLNPFIYLLDELSFWQGNPFLQPQLTHRANLQYAYKSSTIVGLTYAYTDQFSTRITDTLEGVKVVMVPRNLGRQKSISLSLSQNSSFTKWWDLSFNGVVYRIHNDIAFDQFRDFNLKQVAARMNAQQTFKLSKKLTGEISGTINSKRLVGANELSRGTNQIDVALQQKLLNDRATIRLVFNDIYKGSQSKSEQNFSDFSLKSFGYYESRQIRINLSYKFADSSVKGPRSRNSALENENSRVR